MEIRLHFDLPNKYAQIALLFVLTAVGFSGCGYAANPHVNNKAENSVNCEAENDVNNETKQEMPTDYVTEADCNEEILAAAECCREVYKQAVMEGTLEQHDTVMKIMTRLGADDYIAVDNENQVNMLHADRLQKFITAAANHEDVKEKVICVADGGNLIQYAFSVKDGEVQVERSYIVWENQTPVISAVEQYPAYGWKYENGYLFFEKHQMAGYDGPAGYSAIRVEPLDEMCREMNQKYICPVGYRENNLFLTEWTEQDFSQVNFYDLFDALYAYVFGTTIPYSEDGNMEVQKVYHVSADEFETVILSYFHVDKKVLREKTLFIKDEQCYIYAPRTFYESETPNIAYPEVTAYQENKDGTLKLTVQAVYPSESNARVFAHEVTIRPLSAKSFQYVSNHIVTDPMPDIPWHTERVIPTL